MGLRLWGFMENPSFLSGFCGFGAVGEAGRSFGTSRCLSPRNRPPKVIGVYHGPSPLLNRQFLGLIVAVLCCLVCPRNTGRCSDPCCPSRNRLCPSSSYGGSLFSLFPYFAPGQDKIRLRFPHRTRLVLCPHRGNVVFRLFLGVAFLSNLCGVLPRPTKIRLAFCGRRFVLGVSAFSFRRCAVLLGFWGSVGRRLGVFPLSLSLSRLLFFLFVCVFFFFVCVCVCVLVRPHFF